MPIPETELVDSVETVADSLRAYSAEEYDGVTESGAGPLFVVLPGRSMDVFEDYIEQMDPLPWADVPQNVYLDDNDEDLVRILYEVERYVDGAILINGAGRISNYTYELEPDIKLPENYPEWGGTKIRASVNSSAIELPGSYLNEIPFVHSFAGLFEDTGSTGDGQVYVPGKDEYGDVVTVALTSSTGRRVTFDRGELVDEVGPVQEPRDLTAYWRHLREEAVENDEPLRRFNHAEAKEDTGERETSDVAEIDEFISPEERAVAQD